jgi:hypothetical protein
MPDPSGQVVSVDWEGLLWPTARISPNGTVEFPNTNPQHFEVGRNTLEQIWPIRRHPANKRERATLEWLIADLQQRGIETIAKSERFEYARSTFGIGHKVFNRAWKQAISRARLEEASRPGRKRKSTQ